MDSAIDIGRNAAIPLGDHRHIRRRQHFAHGMQKLRRANPAIGTDKPGAEPGQLYGEFGRRVTHHGLGGRIECHAGSHRKAGGSGGVDGRLHLFQRLHRLDPQHVHPSIQKRGCLGGESGTGIVLVERTHGSKQLACRPHGPGNHNLAAGAVPAVIGSASGDPRAGAVQLVNTVLRIVQFKSVGSAAKGVC